jgi:hypothetical protein
MKKKNFAGVFFLFLAGTFSWAFAGPSVPEDVQPALSNHQQSALPVADTLDETQRVLPPLLDGSLAAMMDLPPLRPAESSLMNPPTDSAQVSELTTPGTIETLAALLPSKVSLPGSGNDKIPDGIPDYEDESYMDLPLPLSPSLDSDSDGVSDDFEVLIYETDPHDPNSLP